MAERFCRSLLAAVAAGRRTAGGRCGRMAHHLFADRRIQIRRQLPALRLRQSRRAQGRHAEFGRARHVRQLQPLHRAGHRRPPASSPFGGGLLYDTLMEQATDEGSVSHPLIADAYKYPADYSSATYRLDPRAKWHDGQPITVDDVIWSFQVLKANSPQYSRYFENVTDAVAVSRPRGRVPFQPERQSRTAEDPRRPRRAAQALVGRHRRQRQEARHHQTDAGSRRSAPPPTRSPASSRARKSSGSACPTIGAPSCR